jgi:hypothetical protein
MWEVMSLGYMPYTGCANREVMQLVTNGGRLEPPTNCPAQLYAIMTQCWHPNPEERPPFPLILERLGYCLQVPLKSRILVLYLGVVVLNLSQERGSDPTIFGFIGSFNPLTDKTYVL